MVFAQNFDWPVNLAIELATIYDIWSSNGSQIRPSGSKPATSWLPTTPDLHPNVITCDNGIKISGNSTSYHL